MKKLFVIIASVVLATSLFAQEKVKLVLKNVDGTETKRSLIF